VIFDTVKRYLVYCGYDVTWVVNITDVDDKLIVKSREKGISMFQLATQMTADYLSNLQSLGVDQIDRMPRATDSMGEIIQFVQELISRGFAYESSGDVFFDVTKDPEYGRLSNRTADDNKARGAKRPRENDPQAISHFGNPPSQANRVGRVPGAMDVPVGISNAPP
jgi:cysteinyl-tRNA synthetase